jgi:hypothetical protein
MKPGFVVSVSDQHGDFDELPGGAAGWVVGEDDLFVDGGQNAAEPIGSLLRGIAARIEVQY